MATGMAKFLRVLFFLLKFDQIARSQDLFPISLYCDPLELFTSHSKSALFFSSFMRCNVRTIIYVFLDSFWLM